LFPKANLQNGFPWWPFKFNAAGTDLDIRFDTNPIVNPDFEGDTIGAAPANWTVVSGTPTVESAPASGHGAQSLRVNATAESAYAEFTVASYRTMEIIFSLYSNGTENIDVFIQSVETGEYQNSSGVWSTTKTVLQTHTSASWSTYMLSLIQQQTAVDYVGSGSRYRIIVEKRSGTGAAYIDDVMIRTYVNYASLHGVFDVPDGLSVLVESSDDASSWTTRGTMPTFHRHRSYVTFTVAGLAKRYWRFKISGTTLYPPTIGQPVLADAHTMVTNPDIEYAVVRTMDQGGNLDQPVNFGQAPRYSMELAWGIDEAAGLRYVADQLVGGSSYGVEPVVVVPDDTRPELVYGRGGGLRSFTYQRRTNAAWEYSLSFTDDRLPMR
jgi:hypothetical protein